MKTSGDIKEIATAMHIAQGNMTGAKKDSTNPFFKSSYSDFQDYPSFPPNDQAYSQNQGNI